MNYIFMILIIHKYDLSDVLYILYIIYLYIGPHRCELAIGADRAGPSGINNRIKLLDQYITSNMKIVPLY